MRQATPLCLLLAFVCVVAPAQEKPPADAASSQHELRKSQLVPSVRCAAKPEQSYALYVPSNYVPGHLWPIIYAFDPGARGSKPLELMKDAAERYGYILAGSNNSRNGPWGPQAEAAQAMWEDTHGRFSIDGRRVYFAGLSGGAHLSARLAQLCKCAQGVFLNGAGFGMGTPPSRDVMFPVFALAGVTDCNYGELVELDAQLESLGFPHFLRRFDGGHEWASPAAWGEAMAWMALLEMKDARRARNDALVAAELARTTERARKLEDAGELYFAWGEYRAAAVTFAGLTDTNALKERADALEKNPAVRAGAKQEKAEIEQQRRMEQDIFRITSGLRDASQEDRNSLRMDALMRMRHLREDTLKEKRPETRRILERTRGGMFVSMIETGGPLLDAGDYRAAEVYFELAAEASPDRSWPHLALARCHASLGNKKGALRDLKLAREAGFSPRDLAQFVKTNSELAPLAGDPRYQEMLADSPANGSAPQ